MFLLILIVESRDDMDPKCDTGDMAVNKVFNNVPCADLKHKYWLACTLCDRGATLEISHKLYLVPEEPTSPLTDTFVPVWCLRCENKKKLKGCSERDMLILERMESILSYKLISGWSMFNEAEKMGAILDKRYEVPRRVFLASKIPGRAQTGGAFITRGWVSESERNDILSKWLEAENVDVGDVTGNYEDDLETAVDNKDLEDYANEREGDGSDVEEERKLRVPEEFFA